MLIIISLFLLKSQQLCSYHFDNMKNEIISFILLSFFCSLFAEKLFNHFPGACKISTPKRLPRIDFMLLSQNNKKRKKKKKELTLCLAFHSHTRIQHVSFSCRLYFYVLFTLSLSKGPLSFNKSQIREATTEQRKSG